MSIMRDKIEKKAFIMRVIYEYDDELDNHKEEADGRCLVFVPRFACNDIHLSESDDSDSEYESMQQPLMEKVGVVEGALLALTNEYQLGIKEAIHNHISALKAQLAAEKSASALLQAEKCRREMDRKLDMQYQRRIAEALDVYLTAIQRDHEYISQIERKIIDDAALEEAKRKERALQEEILKQKAAKAEEEARRETAKKAEEDRKFPKEDERVAEEAAEKMTEENLDSESNIPKHIQATGKLVMASKNALEVEERSLLKYKELEEINQPIISSSENEFRSMVREVVRRIKQITGAVSVVRSKASEFLKLLNDPQFPQSVTVALFAKKVISIYETPNGNFNSSAFACGHVIVYISSQVPAVMDCLLVEFHKACVYTVPKHYMKSAFETEEAYFKAIGFREEEGKLETRDQYLERLSSCMRLYGAILQTEAQGVVNMHGLEHGWVWLASFLNNLPANEFTAVALEAFLRMAGFGLHRKYESQFRKILEAILQQFIPAIENPGDPKVRVVITRLRDYIESKDFLKEPQGWRLKDNLLSSALF